MADRSGGPSADRVVFLSSTPDLVTAVGVAEEVCFSITIFVPLETFDAGHLAQFRPINGATVSAVWSSSHAPSSKDTFGKRPLHRQILGYNFGLEHACHQGWNYYCCTGLNSSVKSKWISDIGW